MPPRDISILAVGLNPAWQKTMLFDTLAPGRVNRATEIFEMASGKGVNFAVAAAAAGAECAVAQFTGGDTGKRFRRDLEKRGVETIDRTVAPETRTCVTLVEKGNPDVTELIEPSGAVSDNDAAWLLERILDEIAKRSGVAICGTAPPGVPTTFLLKIAETAENHGVPLLLDAYKDTAPILESGAVEVLKINRAETAALTGLDSIEEGANALAEKHSIPVVAVTDGPNPAFIRTNEYAALLHPPKTKCLNPIGAGDVVSAVLFAGLLQGLPPENAFENALRAGSKSCESILPANLPEKIPPFAEHAEKN